MADLTSLAKLPDRKRDAFARDLDVHTWHAHPNLQDL